jgi:hypothetical protein
MPLCGPKIAAFLKDGNSSTAFPIYEGGATHAQAVGPPQFIRNNHWLRFSVTLLCAFQIDEKRYFMNEIIAVPSEWDTLPAPVAIELTNLSYRFFTAKDELDYEELAQYIDSILEREPPLPPVAQAVLSAIQTEVDERLVMLEAVGRWAQENRSHYALTTIEPERWRISVTTLSDRPDEIAVYATKAWDSEAQDVVILLNPGGDSPEPLVY